MPRKRNNLVLVRYNKVTNHSFTILSGNFPESWNVQWTDPVNSRRMDILSYNEVHELLASLHPNIVLVGDIFWKTGQNICRWCRVNRVICGFLQHGQWIYIPNKKNPVELPNYTFFFGKDVYEQCQKWPYGKRSQLCITGNPRYDGCGLGESKDYIYFSPPAILELNSSASSILHVKQREACEMLRGLDQKHQLLIHPHYREGSTHELGRIFPEAQFVDPAADPFQLIINSKMVLTHRNSTVVLDAIAHGKKTVLMNFRDGLHSVYPRGYFQLFARESDDVAELDDNLRDTTFMPYNDKYIESAKRYIYLGNASQRIIDILNEKSVS